ncbi:hypothetical protein C8R45DRAFT_990845 [Mycena sanguinolenta]|nr:hypothetical protein C8R45DRAFT_990845 [Mycena sanguinolenta]
MVQLPQELIDAIVDQVAVAEDIYDPLARTDTALRACALTGHAFVAPAQRQLFHFVSLARQKYEMLAEKFVAAPHLSLYVRDLELYLPDHRSQYYPSLITTMALLTQVERLVLWGATSAELTSVPDDFWPTFHSLLALPSLRCFGMIGSWEKTLVPSSLIRYALASYEKVELMTTVHLDAANDDLSFPSSPKPRALRRLALGYPYGEEVKVLRALLLSPDVDLRHVRHLRLVLPLRGSFSGLLQIALRCDSIEHLEFDFGRRIGYEPAELPPIPALRFLTLRQNHKRLDVREDLILLLATLPDRTPNVEVVTIEIHAQDRWQPEFEPHWPDVVDSALKLLSHLQNIVFRIYAWRQDAAKFSDDIKKKLPDADAAGLLVFSIKPQDILSDIKRFWE